jgi:hypothetical protein
MYEQSNLKRKFIQVMLESGLDTARIQKSIGCSAFLVDDVRSRIARSCSIFITPPPNPRYKVTEQIIQYINIATFANPNLNSENLSKEIAEEFTVSLCRRTIDGIREDLGYTWSSRWSTFVLTEKHIALRLSFANHHLENNTSWSNVLFSDESYFEIGPDRRMVWRRTGDFREEVLAVRCQHPIKLMVWGGICENFKSELLIFAEGETLDAQTYIRKVWEETGTIAALDQRFGTEGWILQQDNAPAHRARSSREYLERRVRLLENWPRIALISM